MNANLTAFFARREHDARFAERAVAPCSYRAADRLITDAAVRLREHLARHEVAEAEALARDIEDTQRAAETVECSPNYRPPEPPAGSETWRLTLECWAEALIHGPRCRREFSVPAGATPEQALATACGMYRRPFGGLHVERAIEVAS